MNKVILLMPLVVAFALSACDFVGNAVAPSLGGGAAGATNPPIAIVPLDASQLGTPSGTSAGARITQHRLNLAQLQQSAVQQVQGAKRLQADMDASVAGYQIAAGTIPNTTQGGAVSDASAGAWRNAQAQLQVMSGTLDQMNGLSNEVAKNVAYAAFLLQSIRDTNAVPDATDEDRRQLRVLEQTTSQTSASLDQLLNGLRQEVLSQSHYLGSEGAKLAQIAPPSAAAPANASVSSPPPEAQTAHVAGPPGAGLATGRPFVVIRFDNPGVEYEQQLYEAVSAALARSPDVAFDLVAVAPGGGTPEETVAHAEAARASTEKVMRSLVEMGLPADRLSFSQVTDPNIQSNEVQLYVR